MSPRKRVACVLLVAALSLLLAGCWDRVELEDQHFVLAMGVDKRPGGGYVITLQLAKPNVLAGGGGGGGEGGGGTSAGGVVISVEGNSLIGSINSLETVSDRRHNFAHVKGLFIGEEVAREGIAPVLSSMSRFPQARRSIYVFIVRGEAQELMRLLHPVIESNPGKYIEEMHGSSTFTGLLPRSQLHNIAGDMEVPSRQALVGVAAVNRVALAEKTLTPGSEPLPAEGNVYAGELSQVGGMPLEFNGSAMFAGDRLVELLTGAETRMALMLSGAFRRAYMSFSEPDTDRQVVLDVRRGRKTNTDVTWHGDTPELTVHVRLEAEILEIDSRSDWSDPGKSAQLSEAISKYLNDLAAEVIGKAQRHRADVFGFGDALRPAFPTYDSFAAYDWLARFRDVKITPDVKLTIRRSGLLLEPAVPVDAEQPAESLDGWSIKPGARLQPQAPGQPAAPEGSRP